MTAVIVHGGAYAIPDTVAPAAEAGCKEAAEKAYKALLSGKSALDAVEEAVRSLEDNPVFNAGHGSVLNMAGQVEMDAIITDGRTLNYGAIAGVRDISNPVSLARMVMERTDHVMLIGEGANQFASDMGVPKVDSSELVTPESRKRWEEFSHFNKVTKSVFNSSGMAGEGSSFGHETVGAVARDLKGNIAAATSTGGISLKMVGRVGDCPLIGAGAYSDNNIGGVSCTGHGEPIAKVVLAHRVLSQLETCGKSSGLTLEGAMREALEYMLDRVGGRGGMIGISRNGEIAKWHSTPRMSWASVDVKGNRESGVCVEGQRPA